MLTIQQNVLCVLLQMLLEENLITQDIHDKARKEALIMSNYPDFFKTADEMEPANGFV